MMRWLGWRGVLVDVARSTLTRVARRFSGDPTARRAAVVVAMNADVARRFQHARNVVVEPNFALTDDELVERPPAAGGTGRTAIFVGRLIPWKGTRIAIAALARPEAQRWRIEFYGNGPDRPYLEQLAGQLGVADRVQFRGRVTRLEVLDAMARADAFVFPSLHDSAGWAVGEASSMGCPVVCLDIGGPPVLADVNARPVRIDEDVVAGVARRLQECESRPGTTTRRWSVDRLPALTAQWYDLATATTEGA
jgi:glycosyltransferase involved in cell wall biosynthesis